MTDIDIKLSRKNFDVIIKESFNDRITGIFGPSGSGKTSLLHSIAGLATPNEGHITVAGRTLFDSTEKMNIPVEKRNIGYVLQEGRLFPHMTVEKNLLYGYKKNGENKVTFDSVVELLKLQHLLKSKPMQISGGERQRTALARSLLSSPSILLLDEPFSAVDSKLRNQILPFIMQIQQNIEIPILVVSHDLPDLLRLTDTLCIIKNGKCIGHGDYYDLLKNNNISAILGTNTLINTLTTNVVSIDSNSGIIKLRWKNSTQEVTITCEKSRNYYTLGQTIRIFISAEDIALASNKLTNVTIQNQIKATVTQLVDLGASMLCIVDAGFKLVIEITAASQKRMNITTGSTVWCLFKSVAIDIAG